MRLLPLTLILITLATPVLARSVANPDKMPSPVPQAPIAAPLPEDALPIVEEYQSTYDALKKDYDTRIAAVRDRAISKLKPLQDKYTRDAKLDEAIAIRDKIRVLGGVEKLASWNGNATVQEIGRRYVVEVTGSATGPVWGTDVYTADSSPAAAAVHAGVLKPGEKALLEFEIVAGLDAWAGSERNGVASQAYGPWPVGYRIAKAKN